MLTDEYELFNENLALVYGVLRNYDINNQDLFQAGCIGFFKACKNYNEIKGKLSTYAIPYIKFEINKELRNNKIRLSRALFPIINYIKNNEKYDINDLMIKFNAKRKTIISAIYYRCVEIFDETKYFNEKKDFYDYLDDLTEKEKAVIVLYYKRKLYKKDIAKIMNISERYVSKIINMSLEKISKSIK